MFELYINKDFLNELLDLFFSLCFYRHYLLANLHAASGYKTEAQ